MQHRLRWALVLGAVLALAIAPEFAMAQGKNPCNPCNPCGGKEKAENPCNPCNPCGDGKGMSVKMVPVNPCHAKMGTVFYIADKMGRNNASFTSDAPLESFVGTTTHVSGYVVFDPNDPAKGGKGMLVVPVKGIETGIPLRDGHLQSEGWLDAAKHPHIKYEITGAKDVKEVSKKGGATTFELTLVGTFYLHGKSKSLDVPAKISYMKESAKTRQFGPGDLLAARTNFSIDLSDFGIGGPPGMDLIGSKVGESVAIQIRFTASTVKPCAENPCNPCNPCGEKKGKAENPCNPCGGKAKKG